MIAFADFYDILTRPRDQLEPRKPFQWQSDLTERVLAADPAVRWPSICALPTGTGKTSIAIIALYAMYTHRAAGRATHRRLVYVVDRRIVADKAYDILNEATRRLGTDPNAKPIAMELRRAFSLSDADKALEVLLWRGGLPQRLRDLRRPDLPTVIVSTVDQAGSSLLFRGYGVSERMRSVRAGLLAYDTLWLLDEAHVSTPLAETLRSLATIARATCWQLGSILPLEIVQLTATPREASGVAAMKADGIFTIPIDPPQPDIARRLRARKPTRIEFVPLPRDIPKAATAQVLTALDYGMRRVGVVVNTVNLARTLFDQLRSSLESKARRERPPRTPRARARCILLTGAIRGFDRDRLLCRNEWQDIQADADVPESPVVAVCTQTIEIGADLDFDTLITQSAPLDALIQRFGRLNRLGVHDAVACGVIIHPGERNENGDPKDPVYGAASSHTVRGLLGPVKALDFGTIPFSSNVLDPSPNEAHERSLHFDSYFTDVPLFEPLVEPHVRRLTRTRPTPIDDPAVSAFLHGNETADSVRIVWRDNPECINLMPALAGEAIELHIGAARAFLEKRAPKFELADVSVSEEVEGLAGRPNVEKEVRTWRYDPNAGSEHIEADMISAEELRAGDTVAVSTAEGGVDEFGWSPGSKAKVADLSTLACAFSFGGADGPGPSITGRWRYLLPDLRNTSDDSDGDDEDVIDDASVHAALEKELSSLEDDAAAAGSVEVVLRKRVLQRILELLNTNACRIRVTSVGTLVFAQERIAEAREAQDLRDHVGESAAETIDDLDDDATNFLLHTVTLERHLRDVSERAATYATRCGLDERLRADLGRSGLWHDLGKGHPGFQRVLDPAWTSDKAKVLLAKGVRRQLRTFRKWQGMMDGEVEAWPRTGRHEILSISMLGGVEAHDRELVEHLIASHHGWGRPFFPVGTPRNLGFSVPLGAVAYRFDPQTSQEFVEDPASGWIDRFERLNRKYGPWGLAYLESILRLADHRCSEDEELQGGSAAP